MSKLYFFYGVMGARKSAEAIMTAYNYESKGLKPYCIKPAKDTRGAEGKWESRIEGLSRNVDLVLDEDTNLFDLFKAFSEHHLRMDVIIVDEVQFLSERNIWELAKVVDFLDIPVMCYGLKLDFRGEMFPSSYRLMCLADKTEEIITMIKDDEGNPVRATMCFKKLGGKITFEGDQIQVGGDETYETVSRKQWIKQRGELK